MNPWNTQVRFYLLKYGTETPASKSSSHPGINQQSPPQNVMHWNMTQNLADILQEFLSLKRRTMNPPIKTPPKTSSITDWINIKNTSGP